MKPLRLTQPERAEAERVLAATSDVNLGSGVWLRFPRQTKDGADRAPYLIFRYTAPNGQRREMGLGVVQRATVAEVAERLGRARVEIAGYREQLRQAIDPLAFKKAEQERARSALQVQQIETKRAKTTLARVARDYHERVIEPKRTPSHAAQWIASLENHVPEKLWHAPINSISAPALLDFFIELSGKVPETASRVVQRLRAVFGDAEFRGSCAGNPADAAARRLREARGKRQRESFAALPFDQVPRFMRELRQREGIAARALEFAVLTAARTGEVIGAQWTELDLVAGVWTVGAKRMKGGEAHTVYLPARAVEILRSMQELQQPFVFPSPQLNEKPLSNMAMLTVLRRMDKAKSTTVHGLARASFSTWANETGAARSDVIEACLAHQESNQVRRAYNRAQFAAERKALLAAWADYCDGKKPAGNVVEFPHARAAA